MATSGHRYAAILRFIAVLGIVWAGVFACAQTRPDIVWMRGCGGGDLAVSESTDRFAIANGHLEVCRLSDGMLLFTAGGAYPDIFMGGPAFSPDGSLVATSGEYNVQVWRTADGAMVAHLPYAGSVPFNAFSPDGSLLLVCDGGGTSVDVLWRSSDWSQVGSLVSADGTLHSSGKAAFSRNGAVIATGVKEYGGVAFWNTSDRSLIGAVKLGANGQEMYGVQWLDDSHVVVSAAGTYVVSFPSLSYSSPSSAYTYGFLVDPDGTGLLATTSDGRNSHAQFWTLPSYGVAWDHIAEGGYAFLAGGTQMLSSGRLNVYQTSDYGFVRTYGGHSGAHGIVNSPDGTYSASGGEDGYLQLWDQKTGALLQQVDTKYPIGSVAISPDSKTIATGVGEISLATGGPLQLWSAKDLSLIRSITLGNFSGWSIQFTPDGSLVIVTGVTTDGVNPYVWAFHTGNGSQAWKYSLPYDSITPHSAMSLDGTRLAVATNWTSTTSYILNVSNGSLVRTIATGSVDSAAFSPDGKTVAFGSGINTSAAVTLYDVATGAAKGTITNRSGQALEFSPDGQYLLGPGSNSLCIYRVSDLALMVEYTQECLGGVGALDYTRDGKSLIYSHGEYVFANNPYYIPLTPTSVAVAPSPITTPAATGTVKLAYPAPYGGVNVTLSSTNTSAVTVPATVYVPSGATSATFTVVNANDGVSTQTATIQATLNGVTQSVTVDAKAIVIAGTVTLGDYNGPKQNVQVTVEVRAPGSTTAVEKHTVNLAADGSIAVPTRLVGTYDVAVKATHWLRKVVKSVSIANTGVSGLSVSLINGDVNGDNTINIADLNAISAAWRSSSGSSNWNPNADLNGDGTVNIADWNIVSKNWRKAGDQ